MKISHTERGFEIVEFKDINDEECSLQQSSIAFSEPPGSSAVWLGVGDVRMHLGLEQVKELLPLLRNWVDTGSFDRCSE